MDKNPQILRALIELFLKVNPQPSDAQFHQLAGALGVDKEQLEAISYEMLGEEVHASSTHFPEGEGGEYGESRPVEEGEEGNDLAVGAPATKASVRLTASVNWVLADVGAPGDEGLSEQQEVLEGEGDPYTTDTDNLALNDGAPRHQTEDDEIQDSTMVDGEPVTGEADQAMLLNDGMPALQLTNASTRLQATEGPTKQEYFERYRDEIRQVLQKGGVKSKPAGMKKIKINLADRDKAKQLLTDAGYKINTKVKDWISVRGPVVIFIEGV
jgi:hypothetical protein